MIQSKKSSIEGTKYYAYSVIGLLLVITCFGSSQSNAWGKKGHTIICAIAFQSLSKENQQLLDTLTAAYRTPEGKKVRYFTHGCYLPDIARTKARSGNRAWQPYAKFDDWHFTNLQRNQQRVSRRDCPNQNCVFTGIDHHQSRALNQSLSANHRLEALFFLAHWIADIHQPMHIAFADDRGGNTIRIDKRSIYRQQNLHAVWDSGLIEKMGKNQSPWQQAKLLKATITAKETEDWLKSDKDNWAQESFAINLAITTGYCQLKKNVCQSIAGKRFLDRNYQQIHEPIIIERLKRAGVRLAYSLEQILPTLK